MTQEIRFSIDGMSCAACAGRAERSLTALPGVQSAAVNLVAGQAQVRFDAPASPAAMAQALAKAGYPMRQDSLHLQIDGMSCAACSGRVERLLKAQPQVLSASVNLVTGRADVTLAEGALQPAALAALVSKAGYPAQVLGGAAAAAGAVAGAVAGVSAGAAGTPAASPLPSSGLPAAIARQQTEALHLRNRAFLALALALPVVVLAMGGHMLPAFHHWILHSLGERTSWAIQMGFTAVILAGPGRVFLRHGLPALARLAPEMNSLVALGSLAAFAYSALVTLAPQAVPAPGRDVYFEAAATIVALILLGRWLEARARGQAGAAISRLVSLTPDRVRVERDGALVELALADLAPGMRVHLAPGGRVALDGVIETGQGYIDESMLTGEPAPVAKGPGDRVTGGTLNGAAALVYRVTATGDDTVLARIIALVEAAQGGKLPVQALVDRVIRWFVPAVMAIAAATFLAWLALGPDLPHALVAAIAVLIIACPCAMGLATPVSILVGTGRGAELGVLFRRGEALQRLAELQVIAFDKTGTLTEGHPRLTDIIPLGDQNPDAALAALAAAEAGSEHPIARAILDGAQARGLALPAAQAIEALPGRGLRAIVGGQALLAGNVRALAEAGIPWPDDSPARLAQAGRTPILLALDGQPVAAFGVSDPIKPGAAEALAQLQAMGLATAMISGDARATAETIAARLGIPHVVAEVLPEGKLAALAALPGDGARGFVGDGINDAPALAAADVGIAMGTGTDIAIESADVVLMRGDPLAVVRAVALSRAVMGNIRQNLFWAFAYNVALIPVAAGLLYPVTGHLLSPMLAAGAMALSSVFVVGNALRLRRAAR